MAKIALLGDIAFTGIVSSDPGKNELRYKHVIPKLQGFQMVFANLEVPLNIGGDRNEYKHFYHFSEPNATKDLLKLLNIGCVSLANNHIYDCKMPGLKATIDLLDELGIYHTGAGWKKEHIDPVILNINEFKIGFLSYIDTSTNPKTENFKELYINYFSLEQVKKDVLKIKSSVDKVICSIHWGVDYSYYPTNNQIDVARELIDSGITIIMGHHPHTFQPFENYKQGNIFYSLGGLTFGDYIKYGKSTLQATFRKTKKSAIVSYGLPDKKIEFIPTKELKGNYITIDRRDYDKWSKNRWFLFRIKNASPFFSKVFNFQEKVLYRIYEYFWGYYQNPIRRLFQFSNIKKIKRLFLELNGNS